MATSFFNPTDAIMVTGPPRIGVGPGFDSQGSVTFFYKYCFPNLYWYHWVILGKWFGHQLHHPSSWQYQMCTAICTALNLKKTAKLQNTGVRRAILPKCPSRRLGHTGFLNMFINGSFSFKMLQNHNNALGNARCNVMGYKAIAFHRLGQKYHN